MNDKFSMSTGLAHELAMGFARAGWSSEEVKALSSGIKLTELLPWIRGDADITVRKHLIDLDADPFVPERWAVEEHKKGGQFEWDPAKISLHLDASQKNVRYIDGRKLREKLTNQPVLNANLLDYLLKNPHLIPEEWKDKYIFFWGTIYRHSGGHLYVCYLYWLVVRWYSDYYWLGCDWSGHYPAAVLAPSAS